MLPPIDFKNWIEENRHLLKPPVGNKVVYKDTELIIMVVGGPNTRKDYHIDEGEEFFYQLKGNMVLRIMKSGKLEDIHIKEGEIFLLPPKIPHSPQRFEDTVGLVVERKRHADELDGFQWYCDECNALLYEKYISLTDIVAQLPPLFEAFWEDEDSRTCKECNAYLEKP
ncbi:MAG TPA: 3-hydroxyanthranilate 3,4-dioxygenase [Candidatus Marinimicrobia bacterium]|nr:3-hydroxyanthranilate 3,4-dioxygenase [Candidatus Neomarinimicrobiota bacterium]